MPSIPAKIRGHFYWTITLDVVLNITILPQDVVFSKSVKDLYPGRLEGVIHRTATRPYSALDEYGRECLWITHPFFDVFLTSGKRFFISPCIFPSASLAPKAKGAGGKIRRITGRANCWRGVCGGGKTPRFLSFEVGGCQLPTLLRKGLRGTPFPFAFFFDWLVRFFRAGFFFRSAFFFWSVFAWAVFFLRRFFLLRWTGGFFSLGVRLVLFGFRCISGFFRDGC